MKFLKIIGACAEMPPLFSLKIVYSYVIEVANFESERNIWNFAISSELFAFRIRVTFYITILINTSYVSRTSLLSRACTNALQISMEGAVITMSSI